MAFVDDTSPFGTYSPKGLSRRIIKFTRSLTPSWLGKRLLFATRKIAMKSERACIDYDVFGADVRFYTSGNLCEKRALFSPYLFDQPEREALAKIKGTSPVFLDIGANVGLYSLFFAQTFKDQNCQVFSLEPHPDVFRRLSYNAKINDQLSITPCQCAIGHETGTASLSEDQDNLGKNKLTSQGIKVQVYTLLDFVKQHSISKIDAIKVDVEGLEDAVLSSFLINAPDHLLPELMIFEDNKSDWNVDLVELSKKRGFEIVLRTKLNLVIRRP